MAKSRSLVVREPMEGKKALEPHGGRTFCGARNRRGQPCRKPAGFKTTHPGQGRCNSHGGLQEGDRRLKTGRYSTIRRPRIQELLDEFAADPAPFDVLEDLQLMRALTHDFVERAGSCGTSRAPEMKALAATLDEYEAVAGDLTVKQQEELRAAREALATIAADRSLPDVADAVKLLAEITKVIHRAESLKVAGAVSLDQIRRFLAAVDRELQLYVDDEVLRGRLRRAFYSIRV